MNITIKRRRIGISILALVCAEQSIRERVFVWGWVS